MRKTKRKSFNINKKICLLVGWETLLSVNPNITKNSIFRTFSRNELNRVPQKEREKARKLKKYELGLRQIDIIYLPKFDVQKNYLFVAIDIAPRTLFFKV